MMIVILIIAVIAAIVSISYQKARTEANVSATMQNIASITTALESYYLANNTYPISNGWSIISKDSFGGANNPYLISNPVDGNGKPIQYYGPAGTSMNSEWILYSTEVYDGKDLDGHLQEFEGGDPTPGTKYYIEYVNNFLGFTGWVAGEVGDGGFN